MNDNGCSPALQLTGSLPKVNSAFHPMSLLIGCSSPAAVKHNRIQLMDENIKNKQMKSICTKVLMSARTALSSLLVSFCRANKLIGGNFLFAVVVNASQKILPIK